MIRVFERLFEMSKFRLALALWTCVSIAVLIFFANRSFKPELSAPAELVSGTNLTRLTTEDIVRLRLRWPFVIRDLREVEGLFQALGANHTFHPIDLKLSSKNPLEFKIDPDSIVIGISYALAPGQLAHALLQNWFIQNKPVRNYSDRLQQILYADIFWAAAHGSFELGLPSTDYPIALSKDEIESSNLQDILFHVSSSDRIFASDWAPQEMRILNTTQAITLRDRTINPLSLRKFLLAQILKSESHFGIVARIDFLKKIALKTSASYHSSFEQLDFSSLSAYVNQIFTDLEIATRVNQKLFSVDALFNSDESIRTAVPFSISYILQNKDGFTLFPGNIIIRSDEVKAFSIHTLIFAVKKIADIKKIESTSVKAKKILAIENPRQELINFDSLKSVDYDRFAKRNKKIRFALFDQESLSFAAEKNLDQSLAKLLESSEPKPQSLAAASETLGVTSAHWDAISQTYRAAGTIEALQIWRPTIQ